jgi:hypothetical protein
MRLALLMSGLGKLSALTAALALVFLGGIAHAVTVDYTVSGWGPTSYPAPTTPPADAPWGPNGYPGDTLEFQTDSGALNLTPGLYTLQINTLLWTINYTYGGTAIDPTAWSNLSFDVNAPRTISFASGPTGSLGQTGTLEATWSNDYLTLASGATTSLIVQGYEVDITPLAIDETPGTNFSGSAPWVQPSIDIMATFNVFPVPVPAAIFLFAPGLGLLAISRKRKRQVRSEEARAGSANGPALFVLKSSLLPTPRAPLSLEDEVERIFPPLYE